MKNRIGLIAEDDSDVEVVKAITKKIAGSKQFVIKKFVGFGCGKVRSKCLQWAHNLKAQGCTSVILLHDLDDRHLPDLKRELIDKFSPCPIKNNVIIIPVREIEAWLLSDEQAIKRGMNLKDRVARIPNPEALHDPKGRLEEIVFLKSRKTKRYINAIHNSRIASELSVANIRRCNSFLPLEKFLSENIK